MTDSVTHAAFLGPRLVHRGSLVDVLAAIKLGHLDDQVPSLLIFEMPTGREVDFDLRGSLEAVLRRITPAEPPRRPGRPRLGVESRAVTLMPRHWAWLMRQQGGASAALRRLVEEASRRADPAAEKKRRRDAAYRVMSALAGNRAGFEEAARAMFAGDRKRFGRMIAKWPKDVRDQLVWLLDGGGKVPVVPARAKAGGIHPRAPLSPAGSRQV